MAKSETKLQPAPLAFPDGGGIKAMAGGVSKRQKLERQLMELQNQLNLMKLGEKHFKEIKPDATKTRKPANKTTNGK